MINTITITETWKILEAYSENNEITYVKWICYRIYNDERFSFGGEFQLIMPVPIDSSVEMIVEAIKLTLDNDIENIIRDNENAAKNLLYKKSLGKPVLVDEEEIRNQRNQKLLESDWTDLPNAPLTVEQKNQWIEYREQLRNIPQQLNFPTHVIWPITPT